LGIAAPPSDLYKRTNSTASAKAKRGRKLLQASLGEDAWRAIVGAKKAERDRFLSLDDEERHLIWFVENEGISVEQARQLVDELSDKRETEE
jgi:uncharacterized protein YpmB